MIHSMPLTLKDVTDGLRAARKRLSQEVRPFLRVVKGDPRFDWSELPGCDDGGWPGNDRGQKRECRFPTDGPEGLHAQFTDLYVDFHLDARDAVRDVIGHVFTDTHVLEGGVVGGVVGGFAAAVLPWRTPWRALTCGVLAIAGAIIGGKISKGEELIFSIDELFSDLEGRADPRRAA